VTSWDSFAWRLCKEYFLVHSCYKLQVESVLTWSRPNIMLKSGITVFFKSYFVNVMFVIIKNIFCKYRKHNFQGDIVHIFKVWCLCLPSPNLLFDANWDPQLSMAYCCVKCNYNIMKHVFCCPHNFLNVLCNYLWNTVNRSCWLLKCASLFLWLISLFQIICHVFLNPGLYWNMFQIAVADINGMCGMYNMYFLYTEPMTFEPEQILHMLWSKEQ
jgi:hypothetical protein